MTENDPSPGTSGLHLISDQRRVWWRAGFILCCSGFALNLLAMLGFLILQFSALPSGDETRTTLSPEAKLVTKVAAAVINTLLIAGIVCLYRAPAGLRWRRASAWLLAMLGMDVSILCFRWFAGDSSTLTMVEQLGEMLGWIELWLVAVLAAEAAELIERPDLTYQTEVAGRLILWGGAVWMAFVIWIFDPSQPTEPVQESAPDEFGAVLGVTSLVMMLLALGRTITFCGGLVAALSPVQEQPPPGQPA